MAGEALDEAPSCQKKEAQPTESVKTVWKWSRDWRKAPGDPGTPSYAAVGSSGGQAAVDERQRSTDGDGAAICEGRPHR